MKRKSEDRKKQKYSNNTYSLKLTSMHVLESTKLQKENNNKKRKSTYKMKNYCPGSTHYNYNRYEKKRLLKQTSSAAQTSKESNHLH